MALATGRHWLYMGLIPPNLTDPGEWDGSLIIPPNIRNEWDDEWDAKLAVCWVFIGQSNKHCRCKHECIEDSSGPKVAIFTLLLQVVKSSENSKSCLSS